MKIKRIISGGQTGADRAALDVAIAFGYDHGGWIPKGRLAEDGRISITYTSLKECDSENPEVRTGLNVRDSDATLILSNGTLRGGSALTQRLASEHGKPCLHLDLAHISSDEAAGRIMEWLGSINGSILNIAGPRHSEDHQIYSQVKVVLFKVL